jgi:hypothetical protein
MNVQQQIVREKPRLEIGELGFIFAVVAGILVSIAAGGWIMLLVNIKGSKIPMHLVKIDTRLLRLEEGGQA